MKRYTLLLEIREIVVIFAIINKIKTMKLTEKDGLFSFEATNQDEEILLNMFIEHISDARYELRLKSYSYNPGNVTEVCLEWEKGSLNKIKSKIKECIEFGEPIPIEIQEEYNKLLNSAYLESITEAINRIANKL